MIKYADNRETCLLDVILLPHRSLSPAHFKKLILGLIAICFIAGVRFTLAGAWPVAAFLGLDILALWFAFYLNYRRARLREVIQLSKTKLTVKRTMPNGQTDSWQFEPYWVKAILHKQGRTSLLELKLHDQSVHVGAFLTKKERAKLHAAISGALLEWKNG